MRKYISKVLVISTKTPSMK